MVNTTRKSPNRSPHRNQDGVGQMNKKQILMPHKKIAGDKESIVRGTPRKDTKILSLVKNALLFRR